MISPFASFANATLIFKVSGSTVINSLGNPQGVVTDLVVTAMLRKSNRQPTNILNPGSDVDLVLLTGRCINPIALPLTVVAESVAQAIVDGVAGEFVLSASIQSPFVSRAVLGQAIEGHFRVGKIWGNSL